MWRQVGPRYDDRTHDPLLAIHSVITTFADETTTRHKKEFLEFLPVDTPDTAHETLCGDRKLDPYRS